MTTIERDAATPLAWLRHVRSRTSPPDLTTTEGRLARVALILLRKNRTGRAALFLFGESRFKIGMIPEAREVRLRPKIRKVLEARCRAPSTPQGEVKRARIVLLAAESRSSRSIAQEVGVQPRIVSKWRRRFADHGLARLEDRPRATKPRFYGQATNKRILALLDKPPPQGYARWIGPLLAKGIGRR